MRVFSLQKRAHCGTWVLSFAAFFISLVAGCGESGFQDEPGFQLDSGKPSLVVMNAGVGREARYIPDADPKTFKALNNADDAEATYAADANRVYVAYCNQVMPVDSADPGTFKILTSDGAYTTDNQRVYWFGIELAGADPATFRIVDSPCAVDSKQAFIGATPLAVHSIAEFEVLQVNDFEPPIENKNNRLVATDLGDAFICSWCRDGTSYYWGANELVGADYDSMAILGTFYAKDQARVYFENQPIPRADVESFRVVDPRGYSALDKFRNYHGGEPATAR